MSLSEFQIIPIDLNFHLQKCSDIFDKNSDDKIQSKNDKGIQNIYLGLFSLLIMYL